MMVIQQSSLMEYTVETVLPTTAGVCDYNKLGKKTVSTAVRSEWSSSSKSGVDIPSFRAGVFNIKPYSVSSTRLQADTITVEEKYCRSDGILFRNTWKGKLIGLTQVYNACPKSVSQPLVRLSSAMNGAKSKLHSSAIESLAELGELKETLELLRNPFKDLRKLLTKPSNLGSLGERLKLARANPKAFAKQTRKSGSVASSTWLEARYGLRPLMYLVQDLLELYSKQLQKASDRIRSRRCRFSTKSAYTLEPLIPGMKIQILASDELRGEAIVFYRRHSDQLMLELLGLTPQKIPETVWELTRLSFVCDWFFSVGDYLSAMFVPNGISVIGSQWSWKYKCDADINVSLRTNQGNLWTSPVKGGSWHADHFQREVFVGGGVNPPLFQGIANLDYLKAIDAISLLYAPVLKALGGKRKMR